MSDISATMVDVIRRNRISTVEVADALGKSGVQPGLQPLNRQHFRAGRVSYAATWGNSNWALHQAIEEAEEDTILFVDAIECGERAVLGDIMCKYLFLYKRIAALVVSGNVRDSHRLIKENYPIWCRGQTPLGCFNRSVEMGAEIEELISRRSAQFAGAILVCDDSGCTMIDADRVNSSTLRKLEWIEVQEDIWYFCIDTLKWSTFETICLKRYLNEQHVLPQSLRTKLLEFEMD